MNIKIKSKKKILAGLIIFIASQTVGCFMINRAFLAAQQFTGICMAILSVLLFIAGGVLAAICFGSALE